jgi:pimeloyl-ACP methyl ester carboxylesterase
MSQTLVAGGHRLEFDWHGPGPADAPTLVFLHEGLGCAASWRDFPADLARATGCGALVYSRAGYGGSDPVALPRPLDYMHQEGWTLLGQVLDAAGVERCVLIGHSDGGSIALLHAATPAASPRVRALVLEAPHVFVEDCSISSIERARDEFVSGDLRERLERRHGRNVDCAFWGWNRAWLDPAFRSWNIEDCLPRVAIPVLVIQGRDDPYGTLAQVDAIERQVAGPVERCILDDCGHAPHRKQEEATRAAMTDFIRRRPA